MEYDILCLRRKDLQTKYIRFNGSFGRVPWVYFDIKRGDLVDPTYGSDSYLLAIF